MLLPGVFSGDMSAYLLLSLQHFSKKMLPTESKQTMNMKQ